MSQTSDRLERPSGTRLQCRGPPAGVCCRLAIQRPGDAVYGLRQQSFPVEYQEYDSLRIVHHISLFVSSAHKHHDIQLPAASLQHLTRCRIKGGTKVRTFSKIVNGARRADRATVLSERSGGVYSLRRSNVRDSSNPHLSSTPLVC